MTDMTDKALYIEEILLNSVKKLLTGGRARPAKAGRPLSGTVACIVRQPRSHLRQNALPGACTGRVNELLGETEYPIPSVEFGGYRGGSIVVPAIALSTCERSEKERIIRLDTYTLTITFTVPEHPAGERNCYAYANSQEPYAKVRRITDVSDWFRRNGHEVAARGLDRETLARLAVVTGVICFFGGLAFGSLITGLHAGY
jgi:hypothetical protein